jgi:hypothetical protein
MEIKDTEINKRVQKRKLIQKIKKIVKKKEKTLK